MRVIVAGELQRIRLVTARDQRQLAITVKRAGQIAQFPVHACGECGLGKAGANRGGDIGRRAARRHFAGGTIGQADREHLGHGPCP